MAIWLEVRTSLFKGWKSLKNLNVGVFETDFKQVQFVFRQTNFFDPHPRPPPRTRGVAVGKKNDPQNPNLGKKIFSPDFA